MGFQEKKIYFRDEKNPSIILRFNVEKKSENMPVAL